MRLDNIWKDAFLPYQAQISYGIYQKKVLDNITLFNKLWTMKYYYMIHECKIEMK